MIRALCMAVGIHQGGAHEAQGRPVVAAQARLLGMQVGEGGGERDEGQSAGLREHGQRRVHLHVPRGASQHVLQKPAEGRVGAQGVRGGQVEERQQGSQRGIHARGRGVQVGQQRGVGQPQQQHGAAQEGHHGLPKPVRRHPPRRKRRLQVRAGSAGAVDKRMEGVEVRQVAFLAGRALLHLDVAEQLRAAAEVHKQQELLCALRVRLVGGCEGHHQQVQHVPPYERRGRGERLLPVPLLPCKVQHFQQHASGIPCPAARRQGGRCCLLCSGRSSLGHARARPA
mmetsp:Transcript_22222/g.55739  ORF Transcript_22222/g.55739 Transcript_22222/m.55739 type:complete len:284 (+) Transcript_22222:585-1436(+)